MNAQPKAAVPAKNPDATALLNDAALAEIAPGAAKAIAGFDNLVAKGIAVQDAVVHLREVSTVATAALGNILGHMIADPANAEQYRPALEAAQGAVTAAAEHLERVSKLAS